VKNKKKPSALWWNAPPLGRSKEINKTFGKIYNFSTSFK
jgi:hypothetical protein